jgi:hypothetical protein
MDGKCTGAAVDTAGTGYRRIAFRDGDRDVLEAVIGGAHMRGERIAFRSFGSNCKQRQQSQAPGPTRQCSIFFSKGFHSGKNAASNGNSGASGCIVGTAALREPRGGYQQGDSKVIGAGFVFALETLGFSSSGS